MIPSQISYTPSQGAYYIPGQVRAVPWALQEGTVVGTGGGVLPGVLAQVCFGRAEGIPQALWAPTD